MSSPWRCSRDSEERNEPLAGTASTYRSFLLIESPRAWGTDALGSSPFPDSVKQQLSETARRNKVRPLLIRRHGRSSPEQITVFVAFADRLRPWLETTRITDPAALLDIDLKSLGEGRSPGLSPHPEPLFLVCTHGKHDLCCAERGRPVASALTDRFPQHTWEVSHIGGDRFAGNMLVLPDGLYYGRLSPTNAQQVADQHLAGHLELGHLRGRCSYGFAVQAAELFLRRALAETELHAVVLIAARRTDDRTTASFDNDGRTYDVVVRSEQAPPEQLTCQALRNNPSTVTTLISIREEGEHADPAP